MPSAEKITDYSASNFPEIRRLFIECFPNRTSFVSLEKLMGYGNAEAFISKVDGRIAGCLAYRIIADESEIIDLCVGPEFRRAGIALGLMGALIDKAKSAQVSKIFLEVEIHNIAAISLYQKSGFVQVGLRKGYYKYYDGGIADAVVMSREL